MTKKLTNQVTTKWVSCYFQFLAEKRILLKHYKVTELSMVQQSKIFVDEWRSMGQEQREYYRKRADEDKERYQR